MSDLFNHVVGALMAVGKALGGSSAVPVSGALAVGAFGAIMMIYGEIKPIMLSMNETLSETKKETVKLREEYQRTNVQLEGLAVSLDTQKEFNFLIKTKVEHLTSQVEALRRQ